MSRAERTLLPQLRERIRRIERPAATAHGILPFGIAEIDRALPGGGLARGALHEILGVGGDEEDGALAAAFAAHILGRLGTSPTSPSHASGVGPPLSPPEGQDREIRYGGSPSPPLGAERVGVRWGRYCGASRARISMAPELPPTGSIPGASCWSRRRAMARSCGRWRRDCALPASPPWSAKSGRSPRWRAAGCSSPQNAPAPPLFCCGAGAREGRRRANAIYRTRRQPDGGSRQSPRLSCGTSRG